MSSHIDPEDYYEQYMDWVIQQNDCPYFRKSGMDDGSLEAFESGWNWEEFIESIGD